MARQMLRRVLPVRKNEPRRIDVPRACLAPEIALHQRVAEQPKTLP